VRIFMIGRPTGLSRRQCPRLKGLREETIDGQYALTLEFENRNGMTAEQWMPREGKFGSFFGPGITAKVRCCLVSELHSKPDSNSFNDASTSL
jgi:Protein of unknown function (DUF2854)